MLASKRLRDSMLIGSREEERVRREAIMEGKREEVVESVLGSSWLWDRGW